MSPRLSMVFLWAAATVCLANVHRAAAEGDPWESMGFALLAGFWLLIIGVRIGYGGKP